MKKSVISLILASAFAALCLPFFVGCSTSVGYTLETDEDGSKYYVARATGYTTFLSGEIEIPAMYGEGENCYPVKAIAEKGFAGTSVTKVTIPETVEIIGTAAFAYNYSLTEVVFAGDSEIEEIGWGAFGFCSDLRKINLPQSVRTIDGMAFYKCESLYEIALPENLEYINFSAFEGCTSLLNISLPDGLLRIGAMAFYNCTSLESIILPDTLCAAEEPVLDDEGNQEKDNNGNSVTRTVPALGYAAFHTCTSMKFAVVGAGVTSLEEGTFGYCTSLEKVYLPSGLKKVKGALLSGGSYLCGHAFHNDKALTDVYFAGSEEEWVAVEIDNVAHNESGAVFDNSALIGATKHFNSKYGE